MRVKVFWTETVAYEAEIDGPTENVLREWIRESGVPDEPVTGQLVKEWYESGDLDEWHDAADAGRFEVGTDDVHLERVEILDA